MTSVPIPPAGDQVGGITPGTGLKMWEFLGLHQLGPAVRAPEAGLVDLAPLELDPVVQPGGGSMQRGQMYS